MNMRSLSSILLNPALLSFLVIIGSANLAVNILYQFGVADADYLARASQVSAIGFVLAVVYAAIFEREPTKR
jgi:hypothetical protein